MGRDLATLLDMGWTLVYLAHGARVGHVLAPNSSADGYSKAMCGREPTWPDVWHGTGTQGEWEKARALPLCIGCASALRKIGS